MSWLQNSSRLSLIILFITYVIFGWSLSEKSSVFIKQIFSVSENLGFILEKDYIYYFLLVFILGLIVIICLFLTTPITLVTFIFQETISTSIKAILSVLGWSFFLVILLCFFSYFLDFFVLISASILVKLDLKKMGLNNAQSSVVMIFLSWSSFLIGVISFNLK